MAPGKRKSPFIGTVTSTEDPILYQRYNNTADILLEPQRHAKSSKGPDGKPSTNRGKSGKALEDMTKEELLQLIHQQNGSSEASKVTGASSGALAKPARQAVMLPNEVPAGNPQQPAGNKYGVEQAIVTSDDVTIERKFKEKKKKEKKKGGSNPSAKRTAPSGPSNADEAQKIRTIMGIEPSKKEVAAKPSTFSFGFQPKDNDRASEEAEEPAKDEADTDEADTDKIEKAANGMEEKKTSKAQPVTTPEAGGNSHLDAKLRRVLGQKSDHVARRVFVGGMPFSYDEEQVREYWSYCGEIEDLDLMRFPDTGRFKGIAFVTFAEETGYKEALKCNGTYIDEQKLKVEPCVSAGAKPKGKQKQAESSKQWNQHQSPAPKTPGYHVAYVGNMPFEANQQQLKDVLEGCNVQFIRLHTDKVTAKSKGFAHVHFADEESLDRAVALDGRKLLGRSIKIGYAQPKKE